MASRETTTHDIKIGDDWTVPDFEGPGRRTIVVGAAWTVPVIAVSVAAPLAAASTQPCVDQTGTLRWNSDFVKTNVAGGTGAAEVTDGSTIPFTVTSSDDQSGYVARPSEHLTTTDGNSLALTLTTRTASSESMPNDVRWENTTTITFASPVSNLQFGIGDIEMDEGEGSQYFREYVQVSSDAGGVAQGVGGSDLIEGNNGWWRASGPGNADGFGTPGHTVRYLIPGPVTTVTIKFRRPSSIGVHSSVLVSALAFEVPCP